MKKLDLPIFDVKEAVETCASGINVPGRAQLLLGALPMMQAAESQYLKLAPLGELYKIPTQDNLTVALTGELMGAIYSRHFARAGSPSRGLYDAIRASAPLNQCPLCGKRVVASVDHYLPQSVHPVFNLTPANLVPACSDCNKSKLAKLALVAEEQTLHPYFDDLGTERWLVADIGETSPPSIRYRVRAPAAWSAVLGKRVQRHFEVMGLAELYAAQAAGELADISWGLKELAKRVGNLSVRSHLAGEFTTRHHRDPNSWNTALYEGLAASNWFCNEGYLLV